jgi:hypothetical protein
VTREADHLGAGGRLPVPPPDWAALALKPDLKPRDDQGNPADGSVDEHIGDDRKGAQTQNLLHDDHSSATFPTRSRPSLDRDRRSSPFRAAQEAGWL